MNHEPTYHLRTILVSLVLTIAFIMSCGFYIYNIQADIKEDVLKDIRQLMMSDSVAISNKLNEQNKLVNMIANGIEQRNYSNESEIAFYLSEVVVDGTFERVGVFNLNGDIVTSDKNHFSVADEKGYRDSMKGEASISLPVRDKVNDKNIIVFTAPLMQENKVNGGVMIAKSVASIENEFLRAFFYGSGAFYIIDNTTGNVLMNSTEVDKEKLFDNLYNEMIREDEQTMDIKETVAKLKADLMAGRSGIIKSSVNGDKKYIGYAAISNPFTPWSLVSVVDEEFILKKSHHVVVKAFVLCSVVIALFLIMAAYIFRMKEKTKNKLAELAYTDALTKIDNLNNFYRKAVEILKRNKEDSYSIVCIDVNNFKYINETYGYHIGDTLLIQIAERLSATFHGEEICARINNDHFIMLVKTIFENSEMRYKALENDFLEEINRGIMKFPISFSAGVYRVENHDEAIVSMVDKALLALKNVKNSKNVKNVKNSKNVYFDYYSEDLLQQFIKNNQIEAMMHPALENKEFIVYLQPKIDLNTLDLIGAEALVRWISPTKGFMRPDEFIPLFEKNGFIVKLDFYVLEESCKKIREWIDAGITPVPISVNQSRINMDDPFYVEKLNEVIQKYEIPVNLIEIELTEGMFLTNKTGLIKIMERIRKIGFCMSMDDFGSGYSSLNLLKEIPVDILKIDKEFLDETANSRKSRIIISQVVTMAKKLGMKVVCEGVENENQAIFLKKIQCDFAQGYLYAKPMPIDEFEKYRENKLHSAESMG